MKRLGVAFFIISFLIFNISFNSLGIADINFNNRVMAATGNNDMNMSNDNMNSSTDNMDMSNSATDESKSNMDMSKDNTKADQGHDDTVEGHSDGGHNEIAGNNEGPNLIFLVMLGNIIVLSIVAAAVIKHRRGMTNSGTSN